MQHRPRAVTQIDDVQLHAVDVLADRSGLTLEQHLDVGEALDAATDRLLQRRLVDEHLGRVTVTARPRVKREEGSAGGVDEVDRAVTEHVGLQVVGKPGVLPAAQHFFIRGDRPGPRVWGRVALHDHDVQASLAEVVRGGGADRAVADDDHVMHRGTFAPRG
jgi:hypothetical protein